MKLKITSLLSALAVAFCSVTFAEQTVVGGVLTVNVADGENEDIAAIPEGVVKIVKSGPGSVSIPSANATFKGSVIIENGVLEISHKDALGSGNTIEVLSNENGSGQYRVVLHQKSDNGNTGNVRGNDVKIAGSGPDGKGAICLGGTGRTDDMLGNVTLTGDATIGQYAEYAGGYRGIKESLDLAGFTLTIVGDNYFVFCDNLVVKNMKQIVNNCGVLHSGRIVYENCAEDALWIKNGALNIYDCPGSLPWGLVHNGGTLYGPVDADVYTRSAVGNVIEKPVVLNADLYIDSGYKSYSLLDFAGQLSGEERKISFAGGNKLIRAVFSAVKSDIGTLVTESTNVTVDISGRLNAKTVTVSRGSLNIVDGGFLYASADKSSVYTIGDNKNGNYEKSAKVTVGKDSVIDFAPQASGQITASIRLDDVGTKPAFLEIQEGATVSNNFFGACSAGSKSAIHSYGTVYSTAYGGGNDGTFASKGSGFVGIYGGEFKHRTTLHFSTKPTATGVVDQAGGKYISTGGTTLAFNGCSEYRLSGGIFDCRSLLNMCAFSYNHSDKDRETPGGASTLTLYGENCPTAQIYKVDMCTRTNAFVSTINLNAGVFSTLDLSSSKTDFTKPVDAESPRSYLNFNGGTWAAWDSGTYFFGTSLPNAVTVFERGIVFDTSRTKKSMVSICQEQYDPNLKFRRPSGRGVKSIKLPQGFDRGGFLGTMPVVITGGGGEGATAILTYDPKTKTAGDIVVTCEGWDYTEAPRATVRAQDFTTEIVCEVELTEDNRPIGPIVKTGEVELQFNCTNFAYNGTFIISNGLFKVLKYAHLPDDVSVKVAGGVFSYDWCDRTFKEVGGHGEIYGYPGESFRKCTVTDALRFDAADALDGRYLDFTKGTLVMGDDLKVKIDNGEKLTEARMNAAASAYLDLMVLTDGVFSRLPECEGLPDGWRLRIAGAGKRLRLYRNRGMSVVVR